MKLDEHTYYTRTRSWIFLLPLLLGTLTPISALAAEEEEEIDIYELSEYTVTTFKLERSLFDAQESIAVVSDEIFESRALFDLEDVLLQTANAYNLVNGGFGIRGVTYNSQATGGGDGELASLYVDGVALTGFSTRFGPKDLWDMETVEVLRGPQSTNVGRNALIGAISMHTKDPVLFQESAARIGIEDYSGFHAAGMTNVPVSDTSALRFVVDHRESDGFITNPTRGEDDYGHLENQTFRGKWLFTADDPKQFRGVFSLQYGETSQGEHITQLDDPEARLNTSNLDAFEDSETLTVTLDLSARINDQWEFLSLTSFLDADYERFDDDDQGPGGADAFRGRLATDKNWSEEIRFSYDNNDKVRGVIGAFYTEVDLKNDTSGKVNIQPALVGVPEVLLPFYPELIGISVGSVSDTDTTNTAFFTEWEYDLSDEWTLWGGFRIDEEDQDTDFANDTSLLTQLPDPTTPGLPEPVAAGILQVNALVNSQVASGQEFTSTSWDAFLPQVGVTRRFGENTSAGFHIKRGYRAGGAEVTILGSLSEFDPEYLTNYELSFRTRSDDGKYLVSANVYYGDWKDQQVGVQQSASTLDILTENAGKSEIYGGELELTAKANENTSLFASIGYAKTKFNEFMTPSADFSGNEFGLSPDWTTSVGGSFRFAENWSFTGNLTYNDGSFADVQNTLPLDDYALVNVRLSYDTEKYSARLYVRNVFDEVYITNSFFNLGGTPLGQVGDPRLIGGDITFRF